MKAGIIIYSQTEHTYSVGLELKEKLLESGVDVTIERIVPVGDVHPGSKSIKFETIPDIDGFDFLVFGSPVHAFSLAPAMKAYLEQISSLENKNVACFVTKGAPFKWTGGTRAIGTMKDIIGSKSGNVVVTSIIVWNKGRDKSIKEMVRKFVELINS
jgi:NAD(P)H dehydrogenase (quinone)